MGPGSLLLSLNTFCTSTVELAVLLRHRYVVLDCAVTTGSDASENVQNHKITFQNAWPINLRRPFGRTNCFNTPKSGHIMIASMNFNIESQYEFHTSNHGPI